eukprot:NODE_1481_length_1402_cov_5.380636_g1230_i0.p1 GENE.NODE_1481_length_1402_cov_5.380636_g1230_i0~~NODE_1481_length_1402_cov_5.380636_g1230_i0.p1  ORF type:complete len:463 (-),score=78.59 NODE_1481_length_1402_cov_5.380636_g1230_i0:12-1370(-)
MGGPPASREAPDDPEFDDVIFNATKPPRLAPAARYINPAKFGKNVLAKEDVTSVAPPSPNPGLARTLSCNLKVILADKEILGVRKSTARTTLGLQLERLRWHDPYFCSVLCEAADTLISTPGTRHGSALIPALGPFCEVLFPLLYSDLGSVERLVPRAQPQLSAMTSELKAFAARIQTGDIPAEKEFYLAHEETPSALLYQQVNRSMLKILSLTENLQASQFADAPILSFAHSRLVAYVVLVNSLAAAQKVELDSKDAFGEVSYESDDEKEEKSSRCSSVEAAFRGMYDEGRQPQAKWGDAESASETLSHHPSDVDLDVTGTIAALPNLDPSSVVLADPTCRFLLHRLYKSCQLHTEELRNSLKDDLPADDANLVDLQCKVIREIAGRIKDLCCHSAVSSEMVTVRIQAISKAQILEALPPAFQATMTDAVEALSHLAPPAMGLRKASTPAP